jgi:hypothetical protein
VCIINVAFSYDFTDSATPVIKLHITGLFTLRRFAPWATPHSSDLNLAILRIAFDKVAETS